MVESSCVTVSSLDWARIYQLCQRVLLSTEGRVATCRWPVVCQKTVDVVVRKIGVRGSTGGRSQYRARIGWSRATVLLVRLSVGRMPITWASASVWPLATRCCLVCQQWSAPDRNSRHERLTSTDQTTRLQRQEDTRMEMLMENQLHCRLSKHCHPSCISQLRPSHPPAPTTPIQRHQLSSGS